MTTFPVNTIESAPEGSKPAMQQLQSAFGIIPNLLGGMSTSPVLINSLVGLFGKVHGGSFTEAQVQIVLLTDAVTNASSWAVAFHTTRFLAAGFGKDHLLEVIAAVAASTISNYTGSITKPPLEAPFQAHAWATRNQRRRQACQQR